ncbi:MAG: Hint domain-containing protein [Yoonia sp.]|nr:Hint domain-containing protein [Yoonia sp.]
MAGYISEISYAGAIDTDFIEVAVTEGTDVSGYSLVVYSDNGALKETYSLGTASSTISGSDVYVIDDSTAGFADLSEKRMIALVDDTGTVLQLISFDGRTGTAAEGPAAGTTSTMVGTSTTGESLQSDDGGASYYTQTTENSGTIPCYAPGTLINTPDGPRAVETLAPGDLVLTVDHGPQPIRWVRSGTHPLEQAEVADKPVLIKAGALGAGRPARDLIVSPQHRILVGGDGQLMGYFNAEALVPAKALTVLPGIRHMNGKSEITWIHFACDRHEVVTANGCTSESLLLGPMVVQGLTAKENAHLAALFGTNHPSGTALNGPAARACLTVGDVRRKRAMSKTERQRHTGTVTVPWEAAQVCLGRAPLSQPSRMADQLT